MREVAPGVFWVRMPIPIPGLEFINLWLLRDGDGWTMVDSGLRTRQIRDLWEQVFATSLEGRPVNRLICTHFHPDHLGQAGWLCQRWGIELWMTLGEWSFGRMLSLDQVDAVPEDAVTFYQRVGFDQQHLDYYRNHRFDNFRRAVSEVPRAFRRVSDGDRIEIDGKEWRVIVGRGHSPEHACLYCAELGLLISGDQVLPRISPHIGVYPTEPEADPLRQYLDSLPLFRPLPADTLVLPAHNDPFRGLHQRVAALAEHHDKRLNDLLVACGEPRTAVEVLPVLFRRVLDEKSIFMAAGEALAHLNYLVAEGRMVRSLGADGLHRYQRREAAADAA